MTFSGIGRYFKRHARIATATITLIVWVILGMYLPTAIFALLNKLLKWEGWQQDGLGKPLAAKPMFQPQSGLNRLFCQLLFFLSPRPPVTHLGSPSSSRLNLRNVLFVCSMERLPVLIAAKTIPVAVLSRFILHAAPSAVVPNLIVHALSILRSLPIGTIVALGCVTLSFFYGLWADRFLSTKSAHVCR